MNKIAYCTKCVIPSTRPGTVLSADGYCQPCRNRDGRLGVPFAPNDKAMLESIAQSAIEDARGDYSCLVPVSGGKDSIYQVIRAREMGLNVIAVNVVPLMETTLRRRNMDVIRKLGCEVIEFDPDRGLRSRLSALAFAEIGIPNWPQHLLSVTVPFHVALDMRIPMILWGENPEYEYGGPEGLVSDTDMTAEWFSARGGLHTLNVEAMEVLSGIPLKQRRYWNFPMQEAIAEASLRAAYLGAFEPWSGTRNRMVAQAHGFVTAEFPPEGSVYDYENLDDPIYLLHDFFKFLKFGFGRASDQVSILIREGVLERSDAWNIASLSEGCWPNEYLGVRLVEVLDTLEISSVALETIAARHVNRELFEISDGGLVLRDEDNRPVLTKGFKEARKAAFGQA